MASLVSVPGPASGSPSGGVRGDAVARPLRAMGDLLFTPNEGQFDPRVRFQARGLSAGGAGEATAWITDSALWLSVLAPDPPTAPIRPGGPPAAATRSASGRGAALRLSFAAGAHATLTPLLPRAARMNYYVGGDPSTHRAGVPTYGAVRWSDPAADVNVVIGSVGHELALETSSATLSVTVDGADGLRAGRDGRVAARTPVGAIMLPLLLDAGGAPLAAGIRGTTVRFGPAGAGQALAATAPEGPADDPADLAYSSYLGGSQAECPIWPCSLGLDGAGSVYVAGETSSPTFPTTPGAYDDSLGGYADAFVSKFAPNGRDLLYSTFIGGTLNQGAYANADAASSIAVTSRGKVYVAGVTDSTDFPVSPQAAQPSFGGPVYDGFAATLSRDGGRLLHATYLGGSGNDEAYAVDVGSDGSVYVTGRTSSSDFPTTAGAFDTTAGGADDAFLARLDPQESGFVYSTLLGAGDADSGYGVRADRSGAAYVTGRTGSGGFPTTSGAFDRTCGGCGSYATSDAFVTKVDPDGAALAYSTFLGGGRDDGASALALAPGREVVVVGGAESANFPTTAGAYDPVHDSREDVFVTRLSADGASLRYSTFLGGNWTDAGLAVALDGAQDVYVGGATGSSNFPTTPDAFDRSINRAYTDDAFLAELTADGGSLLYSTFLGGRGVCKEGDCFGDVASSVEPDPGGGIWLTGTTYSTDFPLTADAADRSCRNCHQFDPDAFLARLIP